MTELSGGNFREGSPPEELRQRLLDFAKGSTPEREGLLPELIGFIKRTTTKEVLQEIAPIQERDYGSPFRYAIADSLTSILRTDVGPIDPWAGGFTAVLMSSDGEVLAAESNPMGKVYDEHGKNLFPYALTKAVFGLHLARNGSLNGLNDAENFKYIESLGFTPGIDLFLGEALHLDGSVIGVAGCELTEEYVNGLLPPAMRDNYGTDFLAGYADMCFARSLVASTMFPNEGRNTVLDEPELFAQLRRSH